MKNVVRLIAVLALLIVFLSTTASPSEVTRPPEDRWLYGAAGYARALELQRELEVPFRLTQTMLNRTFVITLDEIKLNGPVDNTVFQRPTR